MMQGGDEVRNFRPNDSRNTVHSEAELGGCDLGVATFAPAEVRTVFGEIKVRRFVMAAEKEGRAVKNEVSAIPAGGVAFERDESVAESAMGETALKANKKARVGLQDTVFLGDVFAHVSHVVGTAIGRQVELATI